MDRDRFDGPDVNHLILAQGRKMDLEAAVARFISHERVLWRILMCLGMRSIERRVVAGWVMDELQKRIAAEPKRPQRICFGEYVAEGYGCDSGVGVFGWEIEAAWAAEWGRGGAVLAGGVGDGDFRFQNQKGKQ